LFAGPPPWLRKEREFEVVDADRAELRAAKIEHLLAFRRTLAGEKIHLVVTVEMVLVGPVAELHALQRLIGDVRVTRCVHQGWQPSEAGKDSVRDGARLDLPRPGDHARLPEAAFADRAFGVLERSHAAIRPREYLRPVVRGEDDNGVVGLADIIEML